MGEKIIYTIGHSDHTIERFINLLKQHLIDAVADVRSAPYSRIHPQFNKDILAASLEKKDIKYVFLGKELGARPDDDSCYKNGQVDFGLIAEKKEFKDGLERILKGGNDYRIALMCAEKEPLNCHRTILISYNLKHAGICIKHILADGTLEDNRDTESRLIKLTNSEQNLFDQSISDYERLEQAYKKRAREIAYKIENKDFHMINTNIIKHENITLFTIGFSKKNARQFFKVLQNVGVNKIVDIRLNNVSQLAGFTKKDDLEFFLNAVADIGYEHRPEMAPSKELLDCYKKKKLTWSEYETRFSILMIERHIENIIKPKELNNACLLCSEPKADKCHRRLVAEYLKSKWSNVEIRHL
jgi:uncharacterized protein (DUF488 family)